MDECWFCLFRIGTSHSPQVYQNVLFYLHLFCLSFSLNSAFSILQPAKLLIIDDDVKISFLIKSISDRHIFQNNLQQYYSLTWGETLKLVLNIPKCSVMTFCRVNVSIKYAYSVKNIPLTVSNNSVKNLGITLTRNLCPNMHIQTIFNKALKLFGVSANFHLLAPLKAIFCSLVIVSPIYTLSL